MNYIPYQLPPHVDYILTGTQGQQSKAKVFFSGLGGNCTCWISALTWTECCEFGLAGVMGFVANELTALERVALS